MSWDREREKRWHLTYSSDGRFKIFPDEAERRKAIVRLSRMDIVLLLFCIVEEHLHAVNKTEPSRAGRQAQAIQSAMQPLVDAELLPAFKRLVKDRGYLAWLIRYHVRQPIKHKVKEHAALWSGSCFQDLVGARYVPGLALPLGKSLPQYNVTTVLSHLDLVPSSVAPLGNDAIQALGAKRLAAAAASAVAAGPRLDNRRTESVHAKRMAALVAREVGISDDEITWVLPITKRWVRCATPQQGDDKRLKAIRIRLALEEAV
jgi:REP element-mobilizing transposase RayT